MCTGSVQSCTHTFCPAHEACSLCVCAGAMQAEVHASVCRRTGGLCWGSQRWTSSQPTCPPLLMAQVRSAAAHRLSSSLALVVAADMLARAQTMFDTSLRPLRLTALPRVRVCCCRLANSPQHTCAGRAHLFCAGPVWPHPHTAAPGPPPRLLLAIPCHCCCCGQRQSGSSRKGQQSQHHQQQPQPCSSSSHADREHAGCNAHKGVACVQGPAACLGSSAGAAASCCAGDKHSGGAGHDCGAG